MQTSYEPLQSAALVHLRAGGVHVVLDCPADSLPSILHWGRELGGIDSDLRNLAALTQPLTENTTDDPVRVSVVPEHGRGWAGAPGLTGHRRGGQWSPLFTEVTYVSSERTLTAEAKDVSTGLALTYRIEVLSSGLVRSQASVTNLWAEEYEVQRLTTVFPVPPVAVEILDQTGRWAKERIPQRRPITVGTHLRESRRGRTGADAPTVLSAGTAGFGFRAGEAWGVHVGWSGNHVSYVERMASGRTVLGGGELLLPGEVLLAEGESYSTPWNYGAYGEGLDGQASRFHAWLRSRPNHPDSVRPVTLNVWEAVYFDHRLAPLLELAERAARVGVERFVLDDGWFRGRRDDSAGLGDWTVDEQVWPEGLHPLVKRVGELGMQFGLWFEPEMVNPDSDLARQHPEWILQVPDRMPMEARQQQVLNLADPAAYSHISQAISAIIDEYQIGYIKWDHNRDLIDAGSAVSGAPLVHEQTLAVYRLMDELRRRHPRLEIESCSSGGARVDLGILERTDRVWASDCIDPLERQQIMRWTAQLVPPELIGSHIGSDVSHTTGRTSQLAFRAITALFGHFGIEWDLTKLDDDQLKELTEWVDLHKQYRPLIHSGVTVRADHPVQELAISGVVASDQSEGLFSISMLARPVIWPPGLVRLPGLDAARRYTITQVGPNKLDNAGSNAPIWQQVAGLIAPGSVLGSVGIQASTLQAEEAVLIHLQAV